MAGGVLVCYLVNLADDLLAWLAQGVAPPEVLAQVPRELREIAEALETGAQVSPIPAIPGPPCQPRHAPSRQKGPGAQVRRRDPVLSCLVFELPQCIFFARCLAIVPLWARALRKAKLCPNNLCHPRGSPQGFQSNFGPIQERDKGRVLL